MPNLAPVHRVRPLLLAAGAMLAASLLAACGGGDSTPPAAEKTTAGPGAMAASAVSAHANSARTKAITSTPAPGYYVDAVAGNDSNPGTIDLPFRSFSRLLTLRLTAGQGIYLHCGSVWRDRLTLSATQLVDGNIISNYGTNCSTATTRITGANDFSGSWTLQANGIWSRSVPAGTPKISRLFINANPQRTAQWPNDDGTGSKYALTSSTSAIAGISFSVASTDLPALAGKDLVGANSLNRTQPWTVETHPVAAFDSGTGLVTLTSGVVNATRPSQGYLFQDKLWMLDAEGEFFHDAANNMLYVKPAASITAAGLNTYLVEGAVRDNAIIIGGRRNLVLSNLTVDMARIDDVVLNDTPNAVVQTMRINHAARAGLRVFSNSYVTGTDRNAAVKNSIFSDNAVLGIDATGSNRVTVSHSTITDTGTRAWAGTSFAGVWVADGGIVDGSSIQRSAYVGIRFSGADHSAVTNNDVAGYCLRLADCAGIYTWNGPKGSQKTLNQSSTVANNRVGSASASSTGAANAGIYLDDFSMGTTVTGNTIGSAPYGVIVHNGSNHTISGNKVWLNAVASLWMNMDQSDADYMTGNVVSNNEFAPVSEARNTFPTLPAFNVGYGVMYLTTQDSSTVTGGSNYFSGNNYLRLQEGAAPVVLTKSSAGTRTYSLGAWRAVTVTEGVVVAPARFALLNLTQGNELEAAGGFDAGTNSWTAWYAAGGSGTFAATTSHVGCDATCVLFGTASANDNLYGQSFNLTTGSMYVTRYNVSFDNFATIIPPYMSASASPNPSVVGTDGLTFINALDGAPSDAFDTQTYFHASSTVSSRVNLKIRTPAIPVAFDNVSVREVLGYTPVKASEWAGSVQALSTAPASVTCATFGWPSTCSMLDGETGAPLTLPLTVTAGTSKLLLRADSPVRQF
jgi:hypothetical protein